MEMKDNVKILRIFVSSTDKFKHSPLYEMIIFAAKRYNLLGATVIQGIMGYGGTSPVYSPTFWEIAEKRPVVIEIIDEYEKIENFIEMIKPYFEKIKNGYIITLEDIKVISYKM